MILKPKILVVDDNHNLLHTVSSLLEVWGYEVTCALNGTNALAYAKEKNPDLILLDWELPDISGTEVCRRLKNDSGTSIIPVIMLTARSGEENTVTGFNCGASDYITKPYNPKILYARIKAALKAKEKYDDAFKKSVTDKLTGLYNRRFFDRLCNDEFYRADRYHRPLSCLMIDIDNFKSINDTFGHEAGDAVLKQFCSILQRTRHSDKVCRWGGEEFVIILPETDSCGATAFAQNIQKEIEQKTFALNNTDIRITISIGIASVFEGSITKPEELVNYADKALYEAKNSGKNCIRLIR